MKTQLGKPRIGGDYWLSYTGPCDDFARVASRAADANTELSAKIQVGCSHEVATIPFVPVPGLLYRKYRKMREQGCSNVMQCWYFGNYPGVMNRAAGLLAYENFEDTEEAFLLRLARPEWGSDTPAVVQAWQILAEGYSHFPMTNVFQYYGPIQDGVVWPLHLKPAMKPLAPSWKPGFPPSGDTIGECLEHFTLPEALDLCEKMSAQWHRGSEIFQALRPRFQNDLERLRDIGLVEALDIQIRSGRNILRFYHLRSLLINRRIPDPVRTLDEMYTIATEEMNHSLRLRELCSTDSRLGFHSEAESHKYYPSKLEWRAGQLQHLLQTDFAEVRQAMESGEGFPASVPDAPSYRCGSGWIQCSHFRWRMDNEEGDIVVRVECKTASEGDTFLFLHLIDRAGTQYPTTFRYSPHGLVINEGWGEIIVEEETADLSRIRIIVPAISWDMEPARKPAWFSLYYTVRAIGRESIEETWPAIEGPVPSRLRIGYFNPEHLALLEASN